MAWIRQTVFVQQPARHTETPQEQYLRILEAEPFSERAGAIGYFLGKNEDTVQALQFSMRLAKDPEASLRFAGATALVRLHCEGSRDAEKALISLLTDDSPRVRAKVAEDLRWDNLPETGRLKQALARDVDPTVRSQVAMGLYVHHDEVSRATLLALTRDPVDIVRAEALDALQCIEEVNDPPLATDFLEFVDDTSHLVRASIAAWLRWTEPVIAFPHLSRLFQDSNDLVRFHALLAIGENQAKEATALVRLATEDPDPSIRAEAMRLLQDRPGADARQVLLAHVSDPASVVRKQVAYGLERNPTLDLIPILEKFSEDEDNMNIRRSALRALEKLPGAEAETLIVRMLRDPAKPVAKAAKKALEQRSKAIMVSIEAAHTLRYGLEGSVVRDDNYTCASVTTTPGRLG